MGFFGDLFGSPEQKALEAIDIRSASDIFGEAAGIGEQFGAPGEFAARAGAVGAIPQLAIGPEFLNQFNVGGQLGQLTPEFFQQFSPTTFEQGLATSAFAPLLEQTKRQALQIASIQGIPEVAGAQFAQGISPALLSLGQQLAGLQQQRGLTAAGRQDTLANLGLQRGALGLQGLQSRVSQGLGLNPFGNIIQPIAGFEQQQGNLATQLELQRTLAQERQKQAIAQLQLKAGLAVIGGAAGGAGFAGLGAVGGASAGGFSGALQGAGIGASLGGGDFGGALDIFGGGGFGNLGGGGTTQPVDTSIGSIPPLAGNFGSLFE